MKNIQLIIILVFLTSSSVHAFNCDELLGSSKEIKATLIIKKLVEIGVVHKTLPQNLSEFTPNNKNELKTLFMKLRSQCKQIEDGKFCIGSLWNDSYNKKQYKVWEEVINEINISNGACSLKLSAKSNFGGTFRGNGVTKNPDSNRDGKNDWCNTTLQCDGKFVKVPDCVHGSKKENPNESHWAKWNIDNGLTKGCNYNLKFTIADGSDTIKEPSRGVKISVKRPVLNGILESTAQQGLPECKFANFELVQVKMKPIQYKSGNLEITAMMTGKSFPHISSLLLEPANELFQADFSILNNCD